MQQIDRNKSTIVIVESSLLFKTLIFRMFKSITKYQLIVVNDEIDATLQIPRFNTKLIIIGHNISFGGTLKLVNHIKSTNDLSKIPIMKINSTLKQKDCEHLLKSGVNDILSFSNIDSNTIIKKVSLLLRDQTLINLAKYPVIKKTTPVTSSKSIEAEKQDFLKQYKELIPPQLIEKKLIKIAGVKTVPFIISEILSLTASVNTNINDLVKIIKTDHALTAKVLKLSNSACYNRMSTRIYNLKDAIKGIGFNGVKDLAVGLGTIDSFSQKPDDITFNRIGLWYYAFSMGIIAREIAYITKYPLPETSFITGLLNNIGLAILDDYFNEEFGKILELSIYYNLPLYEVEKRLLGITHNEISSRLLTLWNFPKNVVTPISLSHLSFSEVFRLGGKEEAYKKTVIFIKLAENMAKILSGGLIKSEIIDELPDEIFGYQYINVSPEDLFYNIFEIETAVKDIIKTTLRHVKPEILEKSRIFKSYEILDKIKIVFVPDEGYNYLSLEALLKNLNYEIIVVTEDIVETINEQNPDSIIFEINSDSKDLYDIEYLNEIAVNTGKNIIITTENSLIEEYKNQLGSSNKLIYLARPYCISEICAFLEILRN